VDDPCRWREGNSFARARFCPTTVEARGGAESFQRFVQTDSGFDFALLNSSLAGGGRSDAGVPGVAAFRSRGP
jgi:hypothetical protein